MTTDGRIEMENSTGSDLTAPQTAEHLASEETPVWVAPLSCLTETDIRATGPSWLPSPEAGTGVISCAS